jgi:pyruvate,water dikinase
MGDQAVVAALRWFIRIREDTRFCRSQLYGLTRDMMWRLGTVLAEDGLLERTDDVVHLTVDEVTGAVTRAAGGAADGASMRERVTTRRAALAASQARQQPAAYLRLAASEIESFHEQVAAPGVSTTDLDDLGAERVLRGLASSSGRVRARARVVLSPTIDADDIQDRILVARETDPGWLYLMLTAKGIVVERGSLLSHTAITGRLLGIPTVVAVPSATTGIADGRLIEIDGATGTVLLLAEDDVAAADDVRVPG